VIEKARNYGRKTPCKTTVEYRNGLLKAGAVMKKMNRILSGFLSFAILAAFLPYSFSAHAASASALPDKLLVGYWHNFDNGLTPISRLKDISDKWDVVNVAFADIANDGTLSFTPFNATDSEFKSEIVSLNNKGIKVVLSLGGQNGALNLSNSTYTKNFTTSLLSTINKFGFNGIDIDVETGISLQSGDTDFKNPTTPTIVNLISSVKTICGTYGPDFILSFAPQIADVQGGITAYATNWGCYLPIIHGLRNQLTYLHVQHYNCGGNSSPDGRTYTQGTADFEVAMADMLLNGFPIAGNSGNVFPALRADQVLIGLPAAPGAAPSGGYINPSEMRKALDYLTKGIPFGGSYTLSNPNGYPGFRGLMAWSVNWDAQNGYEFSNSYRPYFPNGGTAQVISPTFNPPAATYSAPQTVALSCATAGASIYYTTNGTVPTANSTLYTAPITVSTTQTIKAIAVKSGLTSSNVASAAYTITPVSTKVAAPTFNPPAGTYSAPPAVTLSCATAGASIYYTVNGNTPTVNSTLYTAPITVANGQTIKAIAVKTGMTSSSVVSATFTITSSSQAWAPNVAYKAGDTVTYNGKAYKCIQPHTSLPGWEPSAVPSLWQLQ
jgi:chitinase